MMLDKVVSYYKCGLLTDALSAKIRMMWNDRKLVNYYFVHNDIDNNAVLRSEMGRWRSLNKLRHKYQKYIDSLPIYEPTGIRNKTIWWCWLQGEENAPALCKACLNSLRRNLPDYQIVVITEKNMTDYVNLPHYIIQKYKSGKIGNAHFSDLLRTLLLVEHGGVWIDSTVYCTGIHKDVFDAPFFVFQNWQLAGYPTTVASNWLISSEKGHPIMRAMLDVLYKYWADNDKAVHYFIYHMFFHIISDKYHHLWSKMPRYSNIPPHYLQHELFNPYDTELAKRIKHQSDFHKLSYKNKQLDGDVTGLMVEKILNNQL